MPDVATRGDVSALTDKLVSVARALVRPVPRAASIKLLRDILCFPFAAVMTRRPSVDAADARDIACMNVDAIASRGSRRDFIDLHIAATTYGLRDIVEWFETKYASTPYNRVHLLKALTYFADADKDPMPDMLVTLDWQAVKAFFTTEMPRLL